MDPAVDNSALARTLDSFATTTHTRAQLIGLTSACIATDNQGQVRRSFELARQQGIDRAELYEIVLQSYLFLGFPRMLNAAETLHAVWPETAEGKRARQVETTDPEAWMKRGDRLCREVYADLYQPLKRKVESFAPDIFYWMVLEGYGKVLSRPGLTMAERELSIIAFLIIDHRPRQLHSHLRGALNCGTPAEQIRQVVALLGPAAPAAKRTAETICAKLGIR